ncbi:MAG: hypothetical protein ABSD62_09950 [Candidatus Limnocylindrales bacterium]|jgi:hypothetical protein
MHRLSDSAAYSQPSAEPGQSELDAALAAMSPAGRLARFWRLQEIAVARSWALVDRSGLGDPTARVELVIRSRYPEWSDAEVQRLLAAIRVREDPSVWLERLRARAAEITARLEE